MVGAGESFSSLVEELENVHKKVKILCGGSILERTKGSFLLRVRVGVGGEDHFLASFV